MAFSFFYLVSAVPLGQSGQKENCQNKRCQNCGGKHTNANQQLFANRACFFHQHQRGHAKYTANRTADSAANNREDRAQSGTAAPGDQENKRKDGKGDLIPGGTRGDLDRFLIDGEANAREQTAREQNFLVACQKLFFGNCKAGGSVYRQRLFARPNAFVINDLAVCRMIDSDLHSVSPLHSRLQSIVKCLCVLYHMWVKKSTE